MNILKAYTIEEYNKKLCVANQPKTLIYKSQSSFLSVNLPTNPTGDFTTYKHKFQLFYRDHIKDLEYYNIL